MATFSNVGRATWARCQRALLRMDSIGMAGVLALIVNLDIYSMFCQEHPQGLPIDIPRLEQLPRSLTASRATGLQCERGEMLGPDHTHRNPFVVERSRGNDCLLGQHVVCRKKLHRNFMNQDMFVLSSEFTVACPRVETVQCHDRRAAGRRQQDEYVDVVGSCGLRVEEHGSGGRVANGAVDDS
jgi:hypothetical protein